MWKALEKVIPDVRRRTEVELVATPLTHEFFNRRFRGKKIKIVCLLSIVYCPLKCLRIVCYWCLLVKRQRHRWCEFIQSRLLASHSGSYGPGWRAGQAEFPGCVTPLKGLLHCGDSTLPGIGLPAVAASGMNAARSVPSSQPKACHFV